MNGGSPLKPGFITGLYQDEDRRLLAIEKQGGLTFSHSEEGDIDIQEHDGSSSIPLRYPPSRFLDSCSSVRFMSTRIVVFCFILGFFKASNILATRGYILQFFELAFLTPSFGHM